MNNKEIYKNCCNNPAENMSEEDRLFYRDMNKTRLRTIWYCMNTRCYNESHRSYRNYGARGIKMCDEWLGDYGKLNFYKWALSHGYKENLTIDRINTDGDYSPDNCKWADYTEQNNNRRISIRVLYRNKKVTLSELSDITGMKRNAIYTRYRKGVRDFSDIVPQT